MLKILDDFFEDRKAKMGPLTPEIIAFYDKQKEVLQQSFDFSAYFFTKKNGEAFVSQINQNNSEEDCTGEAWSLWYNLSAVPEPSVYDALTQIIAPREINSFPSTGTSIIGEVEHCDHLD